MAIRRGTPAACRLLKRQKPSKRVKAGKRVLLEGYRVWTGAARRCKVAAQCIPQKYSVPIGKVIARVASLHQQLLCSHVYDISGTDFVTAFIQIVGNQTPV